jgi:hypothetical protein
MKSDFNMAKRFFALASAIACSLWQPLASLLRNSAVETRQQAEVARLFDFGSRPFSATQPSRRERLFLCPKRHSTERHSSHVGSVQEMDT